VAELTGKENPEPFCARVEIKKGHPKGRPFLYQVKIFQSADLSGRNSTLDFFIATSINYASLQQIVFNIF
jgi:hypothetical protein